MAPWNEKVEEAYFFSCNSCPRVFFLKSALEAHTRAHRADQLLSLVTRRVPVISLHDIGRRIKKCCPTCGQDIILSEFGVHLKSHDEKHKKKSTQKAGKKWSRACSKCNYIAPSATHFKNHIKLHIDERQSKGVSSSHTCLICAAAFSKETSLRLHTIKKHSTATKKLIRNTKITLKPAAAPRLRKLRRINIKSDLLTMPELELSEMDYNNSSNSQSEPPELDMEEDGSSCNFDQNGQNDLVEETCQTCGDSVLVSNLLEHVASHLEVGQGICTLCDYAAGNKQDLVDHLSTHYNIKAYACTYCPKAYHWKHSLVRHCANAHSIGKKIHQCTVCGKVFSTAKEETRHALTHITEKKLDAGTSQIEATAPLKVIEEPSQLPSAPAAVRRTPERPYKCQYCKKTFNKKKLCKSHEAAHRRAERERAINPNGTIPDLVHRNFNRNHVFNKPKRKKNNSSNIEVDVDRTIRKCKTCGEEMLLAELLVHIKNHVTKDQRQCDLCKHVYANVESLREHMHTHYGLEPHRCMICGKTYSLKQSVLNHIIRNHKAAKPLEFYSCTIPPSPKLKDGISHKDKSKKVKIVSPSDSPMRTPSFSPALSGVSSLMSGVKPQPLRFQQVSPCPSPMSSFGTSSSSRFQQPVVDPNLQKKPPRPINFQCNFCQRVFTTKFSVQRHEAKLHDYIDTDNKRVYKTTYAPEDSDTNGMESQSSESSDNPHFGQWAYENGLKQTLPDITLSCYNVSSNGEILTNDYGIPFRSESLQSEIRGLLLEQEITTPEVSVREIPTELY